MLRQFTVTLIVAATSCVAAACSSGSGAIVAQVAPKPAAVVQSAPPTPAHVATDPVADLLSAADKHFESGRHELTLGHLATAKAVARIVAGPPRRQGAPAVPGAP